MTCYSHEKFTKDISERIRKLRKERGLSLHDMVVKYGFHASHWQVFERGTRGISLPSLLKIAEAFDMRLCDLIGDAGELPAEPPALEAEAPPRQKTPRKTVS